MKGDPAQKGRSRNKGPQVRVYPRISRNALIAFLRSALGRCKMGVDDNAVVDPELPVHGIEGLRVADASVMPTVVCVNTNPASIMIGEKTAELVSRSGTDRRVGEVQKG